MTTSSRISNDRFRFRRAHLVLAAAIALPLAACGVADADGDVSEAVVCTRTPAGEVEATGTVTNHSSKPSTYWVDIAVSIDGNEVDTRTAVVEDVAPGDSVPLAATVSDAPRGDPTCEVTEVLRLKA